MFTNEENQETPSRYNHQYRHTGVNAAIFTKHEVAVPDSIPPARALFPSSKLSVPFAVSGGPISFKAADSTHPRHVYPKPAFLFWPPERELSVRALSLSVKSSLSLGKICVGVGVCVCVDTCSNPTFTVPHRYSIHETLGLLPGGLSTFWCRKITGISVIVQC